jgi:glycosyltransferase involved in cell wall biosynthesis
MLQTHKPNNRIRVLHIITRLIKGGAQINTLLTATSLDKSRYCVTLISGQSIGTEGEIESEARRLGVDLIIIPEIVREVNPLLDLKALLKLYRLIKKGAYDIVHTHTSKAGILGRVAAMLAGTRIIIHTPHGSNYCISDADIPSVSDNWAKLELFFWLDKATAMVTQKIIALTNLEAEHYMKIGMVRDKCKLATIYSGIDLKKFANVKVDKSEWRARLGISRSSSVIITVARLTGEKGYTYLIDAAKKVVSELENVKFLFVGDGILRSKLEERVHQLGMDEVIMFLGLRDDVPELLAISDLFVLPSLYEAQGRVLVEAMAAGLPVVATSVGGIAEVVVHGETGLLVPPRAPQELATAITDLILDEEKAKRMGQAGRKRVNPEFSVETMVEKIDKLYCSLIQAKRASVLERK